MNKRQLNKYSKKIIEFIKSPQIREFINLNITEENKYSKYPTIQELKNKLNDSQISYDNSELKLIEKSELKYIHKISDFPLDYIVLKFANLIPKNLKWDEFVEWYRTNQSNINISNIAKKNKTTNEIINKPPQNRSKLHEIIYDNPFVSLDVKQHAEISNLLYEHYNYDKINLHLYTIDNCRPDLEIIIKIIEWFRLLTKKFKIELVIFYGKQKKMIAKNDSEYLCPDNVNSGSTLPQNFIHIWREEEFYKVLIHELIHYVEFDFYVFDKIYNEINKVFHDHFNLEDKESDKVNESYTEILATIMHSILIEHYTDYNLDEILNIEKYFLIFQVAKILHFFDNDKYETLKYAVKNIEIKQTTSVCSYYIVKLILFLNLDKLFDFWGKTNLKLCKTCPDYPELYKNILETEINKHYEEVIKKFMELLKKPEDNFVYKTMRMTAFQFI
jgi:hypothetical protein